MSSARLIGSLPFQLHDEAAVLRTLNDAGRALNLEQPSRAALKHFQRASDQVGRGAYREAVKAYVQALKETPGFAQAYAALGVSLGQLGLRLAESACCDIAIKLKPDFNEAFLVQARALMSLGRPAEAASAFAKAAAGMPFSASLYVEQGNASRAAGQPAAALDAYQRALRLQPRNPEAQANAGCALQDLGQLDEAISCYRAALQLVPDHAETHRNLGTALQTTGAFEEALEAYRTAVRLKPLDASAHSYMGSLLSEMGRMRDAEDAFTVALTQAPDDADAHFNHGLALLKAGRMREGWAEHEWRWAGIMPPHGIKRPMWRGEPAQGQTILLHAEQGLGDTLQFVRYAALAAERGFRVVLEVQEPLVRLMREIPGIDAVIPSGSERPDFDLHCPMMSLPYAFGTDRDSIPANIPYLTAPTALRHAWSRIIPAGDELRVGLVWAGNPRIGDARCHFVDRRRSVSLGQLAPLSCVQGIRWFSLQKGNAPAPRFSAPFGLVDLMDQVTDFADTAALITNLDLVITVDTSVAHLAGALGKPVWMLSRFDGCWRWPTDHDDTPWYPTMTLYRQTMPGDWDSVISRMARDLASLPHIREHNSLQLSTHNDGLITV